jgi:2-polyprenyl-6-methoxyphenol hydroxylase-like FAD-dependent oxidoreductase
VARWRNGPCEYCEQISRNQNRMRYYEGLPRYLEGFLVAGDAVYTLNPVYALGMTAAAMGGLALDRSLKAQRRQRTAGDVAGLARRFQAELARTIAPIWALATREDRRWPATQDVEVLNPGQGWTPGRGRKAIPVSVSYSLA